MRANKERNEEINKGRKNQSANEASEANEETSIDLTGLSLLSAKDCPNEIAMNNNAKCEMVAQQVACK